MNKNIPKIHQPPKRTEPFKDPGGDGMFRSLQIFRVPEEDEPYWSRLCGRVVFGHKLDDKARIILERVGCPTDYSTKEEK